MKIISKTFLVIILILLPFSLFYFFYHNFGQIRLIVRGDDMGFCQAANLGCIKSYQEGILTTVEVMPPCDYFFEAVELLKQNPGLDVGIHLTLNSEWENVKWGPLTKAPSLVKENGHFFQMTWPDGAHPPEKALGTADWSYDEIEKELRAQIELTLKHLPQCSHATPHMGFHSISPRIRKLVVQLVKEYNIDANLRLLPFRQISLFGDAFTNEGMVKNAVKVLENLGPGTWEFYEHPGMSLEDEQGAWHIGAENDAEYRANVTKALTNDKLLAVIKNRKIKLVGYDDLKFWQ
jgi:chitin disaccharide deacetylase